MNDKWWLDSQTVRGSLLAVLPTITLVLKLAGVDVADGELNTIVETIVSVLGMVGVLMAIAGRFKAKQPLTFQKENK